MITAAILVVIAAGALVILLLRWHDRMATRDMDRWIRDFNKNFPGRCQVCSFHQYGIDHGYEQPGSLPRPHHCVEEAKRHLKAVK